MTKKSRVLIIQIIVGCFSIALVQSAAHASGKIYYGSRAGMQVTIISMEGLDTARSIIRTKHTKEDAIAYCEEYVLAVSEKCVQDELNKPLNDEVSANCNTGVFSNFYGERLQYLGSNKQGLEPKHLLRNVATGQIANGSSASGYPTNIGIFQALCPQKLVSTVLPTTGVITSPSMNYAGSWYVSNSSECRKRPSESGELVTYIGDRMSGPEISCKILKTMQKGQATELSLLCNGEGQTGIKQKEIVEVVDGKLRVTSIQNGRRTTDTYSRCP